jgi:hypothetical protein
MKVCQRGTWNGRMLVETTFSLLTTVFHCKKVRQRVWGYFRARVAWTMAAFNLLAQWGLERSMTTTSFTSRWPNSVSSTIG